MVDLIITHTSAEGTLIDGTERGDGTAAILKSNGWRWGRSISAWFVPYSRDRAPKRWVIERTTAALVAEGFDVEVAVDAAPRSEGDAERDRQARSEERAAKLTARAATHEQAATNAWEGVQAITDRIPLGQPILLGHHSQAKAERDQERIHCGMGKAISEGERAAELARQASQAAAATEARNNPITVGNRVELLAADLRKHQRSLVLHRASGGGVEQGAGLRLTEAIAHLSNELEFWQGVRSQQLAEGEAGDYSPATVKAGDQVMISGIWRTVVRANPKTVTVETEYSWTDRCPWHKVTDHRGAQEKQS